MPILRKGECKLPDWCELESYQILELAPGQKRAFARSGERERVVVSSGICSISSTGGTVSGSKGSIVEVWQPGDQLKIDEIVEAVKLVHLSGHWKSETGGCGLFQVNISSDPKDCGDPFGYSKYTNFDRHYHDCDEYWILLDGSGVAISENVAYRVGRGDCLITGMGHHHDFPEVFEPVRAVYFETSLEGKKRTGHLWEHTHGKADPKPKRI
jgi:mannose-6-phosphate isomerase-like protein (cupin superfamily)